VAAVVCCCVGCLSYAMAAPQVPRGCCGHPSLPYTSARHFRVKKGWKKIKTDKKEAKKGRAYPCASCSLPDLWKGGLSLILYETLSRKFCLLVYLMIYFSVLFPVLFLPLWLFTSIWTLARGRRLIRQQAFLAVNKGSTALQVLSMLTFPPPPPIQDMTTYLPAFR
jgi:hypothetical protein